MKKPLFTLLFDIKSFERVHLGKDVGMIPSTLTNEFGLITNIVFYANKNNVDLSNNENGVNMHRLKLNFFNRVSFLEFFLSPMVFYLLKNAKKIDTLMLIHLKRQNFFYRFIYKLFNPNGKVYLKLDIGKNALNDFRNYRQIEMIKIKFFDFYRFKFFFHIIRSKIAFIFLKSQILKIDLISAETRNAIEIINETTQYILKTKLLLLYNGISINTGMYKLRRDFSAKENIIISVGRIGAKVKNNEMLLKAIALVDLKNWTVFFIGPVENSFELYTENFVRNLPHLKGKIIFTGNISNKNELYSFYSRSKVFCLTSLSEGFPLVFPEALFYGNYIVSSKVGAEADITNFGQIGESVNLNDHMELANILQKIINDEKYIEGKFEMIINYCEEFFIWKSILKDLYNKLNDRTR
jgi:glycosyltransferase involved in cell wall biosynthesis